MLVRIFNMIATSGFLAALECTKFVFSRGTTLGELIQCSLRPLDGLRGTYVSREGWKGGRVTN